eukprot:482031_1
MISCGHGHNRGLKIVPCCSRFLWGGFWVFESLTFTYGLRPVFMTLRPDSTFQPPWLNTIDMPRVGLRRPEVTLGNGGRVRRGYARASAAKVLANQGCDPTHCDALYCESGLAGEESAAFRFSKHNVKQWGRFVLVLVTTLVALNYFWLDPNTGYGTVFVHWAKKIGGGDSHVTISILISIFALFHSGLATLRRWGETLVGARAWRVLFGVVSIPTAVTALFFFVNHRAIASPTSYRCGGIQLWDIQSVPGVHALVWIVNFLSFLFLYPSTFSLLEIAAIEKPKVHLWETGIIRITRHPQTVGQIMWCIAHTAWIGTSVTTLTSAWLMAYHLFSIWNGDRRLAEKHGEAFEKVKERTSIFPFAAILDKRQVLPVGYWKELITAPYAVVIGITLATYFAHPFIQNFAANLHW